MRFVFYTHSLVSDWNHGNAHFLRGVMRDLVRRGHEAIAFEPEDGWSRRNLMAEQGPKAIAAFERRFPELSHVTYGPDHDPETAVEGADVVIVHEWADPAIVSRLGEIRARHGRFVLLFHDTHHRAVSAETEIATLSLDGYDGVLAFGEALRQRYLSAGWGRQVFTWHEAADADLFRPLPAVEPSEDLIWIGNWGDGERSREIDAFLIGPARRLGLTGSVHGVRYPPSALGALEQTDLSYRGWIANADVPAAYALHRATVHIPRRPYVEALPGIPTIRVFEALACGVPLISAPWDDAENLFRAGEDFLFVRDGAAMERALGEILADPHRAEALSRSGRETVLSRHTCRHRVDELLSILQELGPGARETAEIAAEAAQ